jgi:hypothetical protein
MYDDDDDEDNDGRFPPREPSRDRPSSEGTFHVDTPRKHP